jgi:Dolichyl-phosphate-mannose-protein mannosyltransferase
VRAIPRRVAATPEWCRVAALVALSFAIRAWLARGMVAPFVMVDELIYSELAKSFAAGGSFAVRDVPTGGYGVLYPVAISPAYALFDRVPDAYAAIKTINSLLMSLAVVPAYLIARRVLDRGLALLAAALAVAVPSLAYTGTVMTENLFYPLALATVWVLLLVLERPTWARSALFVAVLGLAVATRLQAASLALVAATAPPLAVALRPRGEIGLRDYARLYGVLGGAAALVVAGQLLRGGSLHGLLGAYRPVGESGYDVGAVLHYWLWHLEELLLYLGVVPAAALVALATRTRHLPRSDAELLAVTVTAVFWTSLVVAAFASRFADRIQERNLFFVAPLVLVVLVVWVARGAPRPRLALAAALGAGALVVAFPYGRFVSDPARPDTLALLPLWSLAAHLLFGSYAATVAAGLLALVALFVVVPARWAVVVPLVLLAAYATATRPVWSGAHGFERAGEGALAQGIRGVPRDWIDRAVPAGTSVATVWTGRQDRFTVNENEFFNRRVGPIYYTDERTPGGIHETRLVLDPRTGVFRLPGGAPLRASFALLDDSIEPDGRPVARDRASSMTVWRLHGPLVALSGTRGIDADGWSGGSAVYVRRRCAGGRLDVSLAGDTSLFSGSTTVVAFVGGRERARARFAQTEAATLSVPLVARAGRCLVRFRVVPTAVPADVIAGSSDTRLLGTRFEGFRYRPPA